MNNNMITCECGEKIHFNPKIKASSYRKLRMKTHKQSLKHLKQVRNYIEENCWNNVKSFLVPTMYKCANYSCSEKIVIEGNKCDECFEDDFDRFETIIEKGDIRICFMPRCDSFYKFNLKTQKTDQLCEPLGEKLNIDLWEYSLIVEIKRKYVYITVPKAGNLFIEHDKKYKINKNAFFEL